MWHGFVLDVNECDAEESSCDQQCRNTDGSYICACDAGYAWNEDTNTCDGMKRHFMITFACFSIVNRGIFNP